MNPTHPRLLAAIREACPELTEKHTFDNGKCTKCGVACIWEDRKPVNQMTGEVEYGNDPDEPDGVMIEVTRHDERDADCYMGSRPVYLEHVLRTLNKTKEWACASDGTFLESVDTDRFHHHDVRFDLTKPLSGQSPATLDWLEKVICGT